MGPKIAVTDFQTLVFFSRFVTMIGEKRSGDGRHQEDAKDVWERARELSL
jgi:hypothetical protein